MGRVGSRFGDIQAEVDDLDRLYVENQSADKIDKLKMLQSIILFPFFLLPLELYLILLKIYQEAIYHIPIVKQKAGDKSLVQKISKEYDVEKVDVDKSIYNILWGNFWIWFLGQVTMLVAIGPLVYIAYVQEFWTILGYFAIIAIVFGSISLSVLLLAGSIGVRNHEMFHQIREEVDDDSIDEAIFITGGHHVNGFEEIVNRESGYSANVIEH